jgi:hypothetical protein
MSGEQKMPVTYAPGSRTPVGFWASRKEEAHEGLPWPGDLIDPSWWGSERAHAITYLNAAPSLAQYRGISMCRLCGKMNGSKDLGDERYVWPQGYFHYIEAHFVKPPQHFLDWIKGRPIG